MGLVVRLIIFVVICCIGIYFAPDDDTVGRVFSLFVALGAALIIVVPEGAGCLCLDGTRQAPRCFPIGLGIILWIIALVVYIVALHEAA